MCVFFIWNKGELFVLYDLLWTVHVPSPEVYIFIQSGNKSKSPGSQNNNFICFPPTLNFYLLFSLSLDINYPSIGYPDLLFSVTLFCAWLSKLETTTSTFTAPLFSHLKLIFKSCLFSFLKSFKIHAFFLRSSNALIQLTTMSGMEQHIPASLSMFSLSFIDSSRHHQILKPN